MLYIKRGGIKMARPKTDFDIAEYQKQYQKTLNRILISFNPKNADDVRMWEHLQSKGKNMKIPYIKGLIKKDMGGKA